MADLYYISSADVPKWLSTLAKSFTVYAPQQENNAVVYRIYEEGKPLELSLRPTESAKHINFPRSEELFSFKRQEGGKISLKEPEEPSPTVIFGALPCDARGFLTFDPVYNGSGTKGKLKDTYYLKRREKTIVIAKACTNALSTCFCTWVGGSPYGTDGADILATPISDGFVLSAVNDKGKELLASSSLQPASETHSAARDKAHEEVQAQLTEAPDISQAESSLLGCFDDANFWQANSASCISCGACTYLCPTCYCFNITDESNGVAGTRVRSWDTCMSSLFTLEASGHNPRTAKATRLKNRVGHKFSYYPSLHQKHFSCVGCGRCIKSCPSKVDIRQIVLNAIANKPAKKEVSNG